MNLPLDCTESTKLKWLERADKDIETVKCPILSQGRRINNFCLGSDPEFVFAREGGNRIDAATLGLKPGLAAGCDQNQRLAELRGWPSSSVLEHVAGILASLRWMYRVYPDTREYAWRAGGWYLTDGIGGHVHFGRKRPTRDPEVRGLDGLAFAFRAMGFFNNAEWDRRNRGDEHRQVYGLYGDIRPQLHGYEYRTLPSWLDTPAKAFIVLTASKLAILDPELLSSWPTSVVLAPQKGQQLLRYLARYYAGRDDDAWILKYMLQSRSTTLEAAFDGMRFNTNFKPYWGFSPRNDTISKLPSKILPACIEPCASEIKEIEKNLLEFKPLTFVENAPTFKNEIPKNYYWLYGDGIRGQGRAGVGDLLHNMVGHSSYTIGFVFDERFSISHDLYSEWTPEEQKIVIKMFGKFSINRGHSRVIVLPRNLTIVPEIAKTRIFFLKMGLFPLWTVETVEEKSFQSWLASRKKLTKTKPLAEERTL